MALIDILMDIPEIKETENEENPTAYLKFFNPWGRGTWYVTEMGATNDDDVLMFGFVESPFGEENDEWGYFTLSQIKDTKILELDKYFEPQPIKELIN